MRGLTADLADRHGKFIRCGSRCGNPAAGLLHRGGDLVGLVGCLVGNRGHSRSGRIELAGRRGHAADDIAHAALEIVGHPDQFGLALGRGFLAPGKEFVELVARAQEHRERARKIADLVLSVRVGHFDVAFALREARHAVLERDEGLDDVPQHEVHAGEPDEQRYPGDDQRQHLRGRGERWKEEAQLGEGGDRGQPAEREHRSDPDLSCQRSPHEPATHAGQLFTIHGIGDFDFRDFAGQVVRYNRTMRVHPQASPS